MAHSSDPVRVPFPLEQKASRFIVEITPYGEPSGTDLGFAKINMKRDLIKPTMHMELVGPAMRIGKSPCAELEQFLRDGGGSIRILHWDLDPSEDRIEAARIEVGIGSVQSATIEREYDANEDSVLMEKLSLEIKLGHPPAIC